MEFLILVRFFILCSLICLTSAVDLSKQNPFAPKPALSSLNSSISSTSSGTTSMNSPSPSPRTSLKAEASPSPTSVDKTDATTVRNDLNNNDGVGGETNGKRVSDVPVRKIAGKKISALFEVRFIFSHFFCVLWWRIISFILAVNEISLLIAFISLPGDAS